MDHRNELITLLGLAATASDLEITERMKAYSAEVVSNRSTAAEVPALKATITKQNEALVEGDLAKHAAVISNRDDIKAQLLKDRDGTLKILEALKAPEAAAGEDPSKKIVFNRQTAKPPRDGLDAANQIADAAAEKRAAIISNRASELQEKNPSMGMPLAYELAEKEYELKK